MTITSVTQRLSFWTTRIELLESLCKDCGIRLYESEGLGYNDTPLGLCTDCGYTLWCELGKEPDSALNPDNR